MTILKILEFPDERLRIKAKPVLVFDSNLKKLVRLRQMAFCQFVYNTKWTTY